MHPWEDSPRFSSRSMRPRSRRRWVTLHRLSPPSRGKARSGHVSMRHSQGQASRPQNVIVQWHQGESRASPLLHFIWVLS
jgi:hypothetical protein